MQSWIEQPFSYEYLLMLCFVLHIFWSQLYMHMVPIVYAYGPNKICIWSQSNMHLVPIKYAFGPNCICIWSQLYIHIVPMKVANYFYCIQSLLPRDSSCHCWTYKRRSTYHQVKHNGSAVWENIMKMIFFLTNLEIISYVDQDFIQHISI